MRLKAHLDSVWDGDEECTARLVALSLRIYELNLSKYLYKKQELKLAHSSI